MSQLKLPWILMHSFIYIYKIVLLFPHEHLQTMTCYYHCIFMNPSPPIGLLRSMWAIPYKLEANFGESLYLDITYDILKKKFAKSCNSYQYNSYDFCKETEVEKRIMKKFNCMVPFLTTSAQRVCIAKNKSEKASEFFKNLIFSKSSECPPPCTNMLTMFGFPSYSKNDGRKGYVRLYFKGIVKVTEEFVSYDLLRYSV